MPPTMGTVISMPERYSSTRISSAIWNSSSSAFSHSSRLVTRTMPKVEPSFGTLRITGSFRSAGKSRDSGVTTCHFAVGSPS